MKKQITEYTNKKDVDRKWYVIDADGMVLGRLASQIAKQISGKNSVSYTPSVDVGDFIIVKNAEKIILKGSKMDQKKYYKHSGYPGGLKITSFKAMLNKNPEFIIMNAVKGMLPKNKLASSMLTKLKVYRGEAKNHDPQQPQPLELKY